MKDEMKKEYIVPKMTVIQVEHEGCLLGNSCPDTNGCYTDGLGLNDGVSDVEHV